MIRSRRFLPAVAPLGALGLVALLGACSSDDSAAATTAVKVSSTADNCVLSSTDAPAGKIGFVVTNDGSEITEFYIYDEAGKKVLGEVENIGPGTSRTANVTLKAGTYTTACKPGMQGDGIRAPFTVTAAGAAVATTAPAASTTAAK